MDRQQLDHSPTRGICLVEWRLGMAGERNQRTEADQQPRWNHGQDNEDYVRRHKP